MLDLFADPKLWLVILIISVWGSFARLPNYYLGSRGREQITSLYPRIKPETWERALNYYYRTGPLPLIISSIPIMGSILTVSAGMAGIKRNSFLIWVAVSKIIRNWILVIIFWRLL